MTLEQFNSLKIGDIVYRYDDHDEPLIIIKKSHYKELNNYIEFKAREAHLNPFNNKYFVYDFYVNNDTYKIFTKGEIIESLE